MNVDTARRATGAEVLYKPFYTAAPEHGVITGVAPFPNRQIMVRYGDETEPRPTPPEKLEFFHILGLPIKVHRQEGLLGERVCRVVNCTHRHDWVIDCCCGERFHTGKLRFTKERAAAHQIGQEVKR